VAQAQLNIPLIIVRMSALGLPGLSLDIFHVFI